MSSIINDFAAIGGRLAEIEKIPAKEAEPAYGSYIALPLPDIRMAGPVVWTPEHGYVSSDTAPSEMAFKTVGYLYDFDSGAIAQVCSIAKGESITVTRLRAYVAPDTDCA